MRKYFALFFLTCIVNFVTIDASTSVWNGRMSKWTKGIGIESDPFVIENAEQFAYLSNGVNENYFQGKFFRVDCDMDLSNWTPLPNFKGIINFQNHNINVSSPVFSLIEGGTVENLNICKDRKKGFRAISGRGLVGALSVYIKGANISDVNNYANISLDDNYNLNMCMGGIVAIDSTSTSTISKCINYGNIIVEYSSNKFNRYSVTYSLAMGGICGQAGVIIDCINYGKIKVNINSLNHSAIHCYAGGISAKSWSVSRYGKVARISHDIISYSFNKGVIDINIPNLSYTNGAGVAYVDGIGGKTVSNCYNDGNITIYSDGGAEENQLSVVNNGKNSFSSKSIIYNHNKITDYPNFESADNQVISKRELNSPEIVSLLNQGSEDHFVRDQQPFVNDSTPLLNCFKWLGIDANAQDITTNGVTLLGDCFCVGHTVKYRGFTLREYSNNDVDTIITSNYNYKFGNLIPNTKYVYSYFVKLDDGGIESSEEKIFTTLKIQSPVYTQEYDNLTATTVDLKGAAVETNEETLLSGGFLLRRYDETEYQKHEGVIQNKYYINATIENLKPNTTYYYKCYAVFDVGTAYGEEKEFITAKSDVSSIKGITNKIEFPQKKFDLSGRKHNMPQKGINIIRYEDGTVRKIVVK